jgi:transposase
VSSPRRHADVQAKRRSFRRKVKKIASHRLVFVDETGVTTAMTPAYAWAPRGERAVDSAPDSWESMTVIAALGLEGVRSPLVVEGSVNVATFQAYVEQVLVPAVHARDVVVFDKLSAHLVPAVVAAIEGAGARVLWLPPYSPDYTPIEEMVSKVKEILRRIAARLKGDLYDAIAEAILGG